jgi:phage FluMu protein Com
MVTEVRCPHCQTLLFRATSVRAGQIETVCWLCRRTVTWQGGSVWRPRQAATMTNNQEAGNGGRGKNGAAGA